LLGSLKETAAFPVLLSPATKNCDAHGVLLPWATVVRQIASEAARHSCRLYVASATAKLPEMPTNPAETPESGKPAKIGLSGDFPRGKLDWRAWRGT
jgi:hypothetical protein